MEIYAALIDEMDQGIGNIVKTLKDQNLFNNMMDAFIYIFI